MGDSVYRVLGPAAMVALVMAVAWVVCPAVCWALGWL